MLLNASALPARLDESNNAMDVVVPRLAMIADELAALAVRLDPAPASSRKVRQLWNQRQVYVAEKPAEVLLALALTAIQRRTLRNRQFRPSLFSDPAWDMLLDLFVSRLRHRQVCVSSLCIAARVPPTTALRWIRNMEEHGEIVRRRDPDDGRRVFLEMSDAAFEGVARTLQATPKRPPL